MNAGMRGARQDHAGENSLRMNIDWIDTDSGGNDAGEWQTALRLRRQ